MAKRKPTLSTEAQAVATKAIEQQIDNILGGNGESSKRESLAPLYRALGELETLQRTGSATAETKPVTRTARQSTRKSEKQKQDDEIAKAQATEPQA